MDFSRGNRNSQEGPVRPVAATAPVAAAQKTTVPGPAAIKPDADYKHGKMYRWSFVALLLSGTILFVAMIFFIVFGTPVNREANYVNDEQYQAVFVNVNGTNGGQVYFGKVTALTPQYIRLANVFYIQNQQPAEGQAASSAYNLVKLGCELHGPTDEMIINRDQVFFWENLKADGQVAQKIEEFKKQNPNGQKCSDNSGSTQQSNGTTQNPAQTTNPATGGGASGANGGGATQTAPAGTGNNQSDTNN